MHIHITLFTLLISVILFLSVVMAASVSLDEQWNNFKSTHNKKYETEEDEVSRRAIFETNLKKIEAHNKEYDEQKVTWKMGINQFTDLRPEEMKKFMGYRPSPKSENPETTS